MDAESAIGTILEVEPGSSDMYLRLVRLRIQAESVPDLVAPYATELKFGSFFRHYPEIIDAMKRCQFPAKKQIDNLIAEMTPAAWSALEEVHRVLSRHSSEVPISPELEADYSGPGLGI
jgi:hypothetical protein